MPEHEVLVELDRALAVEVDVEELARPQRLREAVRVVEARHLLVARLRVEADDVAVVERVDEGDRVADARQEDVAARLVGLRLQRDAQVVALLLDVGGDGVDALRVAGVRRDEVLRVVVLGALAAAPHDERGGAHLGGVVDAAQHLLQAVAAHGAVVRGECAVLEDRVAEGIGGDHLADEAGLLRGLLHRVDATPALGLVGAEREDVVVVVREAPRAQVRELADGLRRVQVGAGRGAEGVVRRPADGPQAERVLDVAHGSLLVEFCCTAELLRVAGLESTRASHLDDDARSGAPRARRRGRIAPAHPP